MTVELETPPKACLYRPRLDAQRGKELIWDTISRWENFIEGLEKKGRRAIEKTTGLALPPSDGIMVRGFVCARETRLSPQKAVFPVVTWYKVTSYSMEPVESYAFCGRKAEGVGFGDEGGIMIEGKKINRLSGGLTVEGMARKIIGF